MLSLAIWPSMPWILRFAQDDKLGLKTLPSLTTDFTDTTDKANAARMSF
jgi:hypothetical protein